jgi:thiamine biosynthesis protein ThiI
VIDRSSTEKSGEVILCRYAEIFLKGGNRAFFERKLVDNIRRAVAPVQARVERLHGRILIWPVPGGTARTIARLERVFGLASLSPARLVEKNLDALSAAAIEEARAWAAGKPGGTFKVETRRSDKRFQPASPEVSRLVGGAVHVATGLPVDVHHPQLHLGVEIGFEHAFVYGRTVAAPGGLPVGSSGRVDLLLSGGIDSPVAGWMAMKRGCHVAATYFHSFPFTGDKTKEKVAGLARLLARWQGAVELRVVPFTDAQKALRAAGDPRLAVVLYRRMMIRVAEKIARARGALALVTGDALGQVASQTLENLSVIGAAATLPILRPLVAHDKLETIDWARRIGTYDLSIAPYEDCCSLFVPEHPETKAKLAPVEAAESKLDLAALTAACVDGVETILCQE